jgi:hypothetical protein
MSEELKEMLRQWQCPAAREGDYSKCTATEENAMAVIENTETGEKRYFCYIGCALLRVSEEEGDEAMTKVIESEFNVEGHYEKLRSFF